MTWIGLPDDLEPYLGFVYKITHKKTGKYYIGLKHFWRTVKYPPLKGRKNKRHIRVLSDFISYWGSSIKFQEYVMREGHNAFKREILHLCTSKREMAWLELKEQIRHNIMEDENSYNEMINVRLRFPKVNTDVDGGTDDR